MVIRSGCFESCVRTCVAFPRRNCKQLFVLGGDGAHKGTLQLASASWLNAIGWLTVAGGLLSCSDGFNVWTLLNRR